MVERKPEPVLPGNLEGINGGYVHAPFNIPGKHVELLGGFWSNKSRTKVAVSIIHSHDNTACLIPDSSSCDSGGKGDAMPESNMPNRDDYKIVEQDISQNTSSFGRDESQTVLTIDTREDVFTLPTLIKDILGYSIVDPAGESQMLRYLPWRHPLYRWMTARKITNLASFGIVDSGQDVQGRYSLHNNPNDLTAPNIRTTILFAAEPYDVLDEDEITDDVDGRKEWERFVERIETPQLEFITTERGLMRWAEEPANPLIIDDQGAENPGTLFDGTGRGNPIRQGWTIRWQKREVRLIWHQIPRDGIYNPLDGQLTPKITDGIGKVNDRVFMGYPPGTLLAQEPRITPHTAPIPPNFVGVANFSGRVARTYTVEHVWAYSDPPYDPDSTSGPGLTPARGWNILPTPLSSPEYWML